MPSNSQKQHDFMVRVLEEDGFSEKVNVPKKVAKEFVKEDKLLEMWQSDDTALESRAPASLLW